ncbi:Penicillin-binding protein [Clostridium bornimense]|uniref:Penicillin-binding protein 1A n=1 Tax=Clostridium bornimense TaxID=1216932 RepID=W6RWY4_9CLOT|nr:transglycosylase domain-containing protein [Clostridium bornimense]CDM69186.1 Penicillin-binding protein [Clostridium bornimense]
MSKSEKNTDKSKKNVSTKPNKKNDTKSNKNTNAKNSTVKNASKNSNTGKSTSKSTSKKSSPKKSNKFITFLKIALISIFIIGSISAITFSLYASSIISSAAPLNVDEIVTIGEPSTYYSDNNTEIGSVATMTKTKLVAYDDMPQNLIDAIISIEDERFNKHNGIDIKRLAGAAVNNLKAKLTGSGGRQGGSTLTQQLIKNKLFMDDALNNRNEITRKVLEIYYSIKLEDTLSKDEILEAYLNTVNFGGQNVGVGIAAESYFTKEVKDLSLLECAFLAGMPQSPGSNYPFNEGFEDMAINDRPYIQRTKLVLMKMKELNKISEEEYNTAMNQLTTEGVPFNQSASTSNNRQQYEFFIRPVEEQVKNDLKKKYDYDDDYIENLLTTGSLEIYTTMDKDLQDYAQDIVDNPSSYSPLRGIDFYVDDNGISQPQIGGSIVDYTTGEVKVIIGGRNIEDMPPLSINRAMTNMQTGSSAKPLTGYAPAIEEGIITAGSTLKDTSLTNEELKSTGYSETPANWYTKSKGDYGQLTVRQAIRTSSNLTVIRAVNELGVEKSFEYGQKLGLGLSESDKGVAALALGEQTYGTTPLKMAAAFGTFGNQGMYTEPRLYTKVVDRNGATILESTTTSHKVFSPETAFITYDLLKAPLTSGGKVTPTGTAANFRNDLNLAGKTGTSESSKVLTFAGLSPYYSGSLFLYYDDQSGNNFNSASSSSISNAWGLIMEKAHENLPGKSIAQPSNIVSAYICEESGLLASKNCSYGYTEYFVKGTQPTKYCTSHKTKVEETNKDKNNNKTNTNTTDKTDTDKTDTDKTDTDKTDTGTTDTTNGSTDTTDTTDNSNGSTNTSGGTSNTTDTSQQTTN